MDLPSSLNFFSSSFPDFSTGGLLNNGGFLGTGADLNLNQLAQQFLGGNNLVQPAAGGSAEAAMQGLLGVGNCPPGTFFRAGASRVSPRTELQVENPANGKIVTYRNKGRALLYADDLRAVDRVRKVAQKANRVLPRRRATKSRARR